MFKTYMFIQNHQLIHIIIKICNKDEILTFGKKKKFPFKYQDIKRCQKPWKWGGGGYSCGDSTITGEWLQILTNTRHSNPFSSDGSIACHTYCDMENPFKQRSSLRTRDNHTCCRAFGSGTVTTCINDTDLSRSSIEPRSPTNEILFNYQQITVSIYFEAYFPIIEK